MTLIFWLVLGTMLNLIMINKLEDRYHITLDVVLSFYLNYGFAPVILFYNLYLLCISPNSTIVKN